MAYPQGIYSMTLVHVSALPFFSEVALSHPHLMASDCGGTQLLPCCITECGIQGKQGPPPVRTATCWLLVPARGGRDYFLAWLISSLFFWPKRFLYGCSTQNVGHQECRLLRADLLLPGRGLQATSRFSPVSPGKTLLTSVCFSVSSCQGPVPQSRL